MATDKAQPASTVPAGRDALTGLYHRRAFLGELERRFRGTDPMQRRGALLCLAIDDWTPLIERLGHGAGDRALKSLARLLRDKIRSDDLAARFRSDAFVVWIEGIDAVAAEARARAILKAAMSLAPVGGEADDPLTVSVGVALHDPANDEVPAALLARADHAVGRAQEAGKGQVALAPGVRGGSKALTA